MNGVSWVGVGSYLLAVLSLVAFFVRDCKRLDETKGVSLCLIGEEEKESADQDEG